jgi:micrococcal nuclease
MKNFLLLMVVCICFNQLHAQTVDAKTAATKPGETLTVCDKIFGGKYFETSSKITLLNMGAAYPKSPLTIVIKAEDRVNFKVAPEEFYNNKKVCVTGTITVYNNKPQIVISKPSDIEEQKN